VDRNFYQAINIYVIKKEIARRIENTCPGKDRILGSIP
jgi:hypothetical protein